MSAQVSVVGVDGTIQIPAEIQESLGLHAGSRLLVTARDGRLVAEPVTTSSIDAFRGILKSRLDVVAELQQERRQDKW